MKRPVVIGFRTLLLSFVGLAHHYCTNQPAILISLHPPAALIITSTTTLRPTPGPPTGAREPAVVLGGVPAALLAERLLELSFLGQLLVAVLQLQPPLLPFLLEVLGSGWGSDTDRMVNA